MSEKKNDIVTEEKSAENAENTPKKMRTKIKIRNPFVAEKVEVPAKEKKAKKAKEPKPESEKKNNFLKGFGMGFAAGSATTAAAGFLGMKHRAETEEIDDEFEEDDADEADSEDDDDSDSEDSTEE